MNETVFTNAKLITPDAVVEGTLVVRDGRIVLSTTARVRSRNASIWKATT